MALPKAQFDLTARDLTKQAFSSVKSGMSDLAGEANKLAAELGLVLGVAGFAELVKHSLETIDAQAKLADRFGTSTQAIAGYQRAAALAGVENNTLVLGWRNMAKGIADFSEGTGGAKESLEKLGFGYKDLISLPITKQFDLIADRLNNVKNETDRLKIAQDIWSGRAIQLITVAEVGSKGLHQMGQEALYLGTAVARDKAADVENFNDAITDLQEAAQGAANILAVELGQSLGDFVRAVAFDIPIAIVTGVKYFEEFKGGITGIQLKIQQLLLWRDQMDSAALHKLPWNDNLTKEVDERIKDRQANILDLADEYAAAGNKIEKADADIAAMRQKRDTLLKDHKPFVMPAVDVTAPPLPKPTDENEEAKAKEAARKQFTALRDGLLEENQQVDQSLAQRDILLEQWQEKGIIGEQEYNDTRVALYADAEKRMTKATGDSINNRLQLAQQASQQELQLKETAYQAGIELLQIFGQKNKVFAIAAIAASKALAIAQTLIATETAAMLAYASQVIPGDPTSIERAQAAYAYAQTLGAITVAAIAATGLAQAAQVTSGGGGSRSSGATPVYQANPVTSLPDTQQTYTRNDPVPAPAPVVQIHIHAIDTSDAIQFLNKNRGEIVSIMRGACRQKGIPSPV